MLDELTQNRRNLYMIQDGAQSLIKALKLIEAGCDNPELVAKKALNRKTTPDWKELGLA